MKSDYSENTENVKVVTQPDSNAQIKTAFTGL